MHCIFQLTENQATNIAESSNALTRQPFIVTKKVSSMLGFFCKKDTISVAGMPLAEVKAKSNGSSSTTILSLPFNSSSTERNSTYNKYGCTGFEKEENKKEEKH